MLLHKGQRMNTDVLIIKSTSVESPVSKYVFPFALLFEALE